MHRVVAALERFGGGIVHLIVSLNAWVQRGLVRRISLSLTLVAAAIGISWALWPKVEYLPTGNRNLVFGILLPPPGYNLDQLMEMGETVETKLRPYWDVDPDSPPAPRSGLPPHRRLLFRRAGDGRCSWGSGRSTQ